MDSPSNIRMRRATLHRTDDEVEQLNPTLHTCAWLGARGGGLGSLSARKRACAKRGVGRIPKAGSPAHPNHPPRLHRGASGSIARPACSRYRFSADSGIEHYRGSFKNKAMFTPLIVSALDARHQHPWHGRFGASRTRRARHDLPAGRGHGPDRHRLSHLQCCKEGRAALAGKTCFMARRLAPPWPFSCRA